MLTEPLNILYLDDEGINLMLFKESFKEDFKIYTADWYDDAFAILKKKTIDVVCSDHIMPGMTGLQFLKKVDQMELDRKPKKILISGYLPEKEIEAALNDGLVQLFVSKPWRYEDLKEKLITVASEETTA